MKSSPLDNALHLPGDPRGLRGDDHSGVGVAVAGMGVPGAGVSGGRARDSTTTSLLLMHPAVLSNSQELDSGVGRTDESTRYEESSEHDLLGDDHTSASNTNATNTPGSMRKFISGSQDLRFSTDSLLGLDGGGGAGEDGARGAMLRPRGPGEGDDDDAGADGGRVRALPGTAGDQCYYERNSKALMLLLQQPGEEEEGLGVGGAPLDVNMNESLVQHEMALLEEELRHLEFKCRNILRAQKMQQLRERCLKAWPLEAEEKETGAGGGGGTALGAPRLLGSSSSSSMVAVATGEEEESSHHHHHHALSDINELPERDRSDKDSTSAYNTGGESCRSTPLVHEPHPSPSTQSLEAGGEPVLLPAQQRAPPHHLLHLLLLPAPRAREQSLSRGDGGGARRGSDGSVRRSPKTTAPVESRAGGRSAENSPYLSRRQSGTKMPQRYQSCMHLWSPSTSEGPVAAAGGGGCHHQGAPGEEGVCLGGTEGDASPMSLGSSSTCKDIHPRDLPDLLHLPEPPLPASPRMEWKVKIRSDGSRYVAKRPVRDRLLKARAMKIREERSGGMTTDDDAVSEMKMGRYWSKEQRKQHLLRAREQRRRREFMMQSRMDCLRDRDREQGGGGPQGAGDQRGSGGPPLPPPLQQQQQQQQQNQQEPPASILELCHRRSMKKRSRRILDNWITIQELLAHGTRSPDGKKVYNPLLSVTTV
ncbi:hypothetical protein CRUP_025147 [Coryphaenoides rupestris]|nr:hypothetical protein CRUP_025147 [Coryphaenoides rupestris]